MTGINWKLAANLRIVVIVSAPAGSRQAVACGIVLYIYLAALSH